MNFVQNSTGLTQVDFGFQVNDRLPLVSGFPGVNAGVGPSSSSNKWNVFTTLSDGTVSFQQYWIAVF